MAQRVYTQTFGVAAAILEKDGKFLLVKESGGPDAGKWNHPAGWIDVGEHPADAAAREVKEETGYTFTPTHLLGVYSLVRKDLKEKMGSPLHPIKLVFIGSVTADVVQRDAEEINETRWFSPDEIEAMDASVLRDVNIKIMIRDYVNGKRVPLERLVHTVVE